MAKGSSLFTVGNLNELKNEVARYSGTRLDAHGVPAGGSEIKGVGSDDGSTPV